jgi:ketosteroid isomerase-like protein
LTNAEKQGIESNIKAVLNTMVDGMNEHNVEKIMGCYDKSDMLRWSGDGLLMIGWDSCYTACKTWHSDPSHSEWSVSIGRVLIDIIGSDVAILTVQGIINLVDDNGQKVKRGYSLTDVFHKKNDKWIIINEHESDGDIPE